MTISHKFALKTETGCVKKGGIKSNLKLEMSIMFLFMYCLIILG